MRLLLATPLYPPDIAEPAPYTKELARRLAPFHEVTVLTYGHLPEKVEGVRIVAIDKRAPLVLRLVRYTKALMREWHKADVLYTQNGPSVELPIALARVWVRKPLFIRLGDTAAHQYASRHLLRSMLETLALRSAQSVDAPYLQKPEILPFTPRPNSELATWEHSWQKHLEQLQKKFDHV